MNIKEPERREHGIVPPSSPTPPPRSRCVEQRNCVCARDHINVDIKLCVCERSCEIANTFSDQRVCARSIGWVLNRRARVCFFKPDAGVVPVMCCSISGAHAGAVAVVVAVCASDASLFIHGILFRHVLKTSAIDELADFHLRLCPNTAQFTLHVSAR